MVLRQTWWAKIYRVEHCLGGNYIRRNFLDCNNPGGNFPGGIYPGWEFSRWELSGWELSWLRTFFGGGFPSRNCPGGNFPGGSFPSTKIWSEKSISIPIHSWITYFWIWLFGGAKYEGGNKVEARGTDERTVPDKLPLIRYGENYSA